MRRRRRAGGFTLVEVAIVVVIVAILAVIGVVAYRKRVKTAHMSEAMGITNGIRAGQNAYKAERGVYADVSKTIISLYPHPAGPEKTQWGAPCGGLCNRGHSWEEINVHPSGPVLYGYATVAGVGASAVTSKLSVPMMISSPVKKPTADMESVIGATDPFFATYAAGDTDGDGQSTIIMSYSHTNNVVVISDAD